MINFKHTLMKSTAITTSFFLIFLALSRNTSFALTFEEKMDALKKQGYTEKQIEQMVIVELKNRGYSAEQLLATIENGEDQARISELKNQGLDAGAILDEIA